MYVSLNNMNWFFLLGVEESGDERGCCHVLLTGFSYLIFILTFPLSIFVCLKVGVLFNEDIYYL